MDFIWVYLSVFLASLLGVAALRRRRKKNEVEAQFVITGTLLLIFYIVCFCSGICTILNFLFRWIF
jgi:hypothetical protein